MSRRNILIAVGVVLLGGALVAANLWYEERHGLTVTPRSSRRAISRRLSWPPKIRPKRLVKISAETSGRSSISP